MSQNTTPAALLPELVPCHACGSTMQQITKCTQEFVHWYEIDCACGISAKARPKPGAFVATYEDAVAAWNRRPVPSERGGAPEPDFLTVEEQGPLYDAVNEFANNPKLSTARMKAVVKINAAILGIIAGRK